MANPTGAFGARPVRHFDGSPWNGATVPCYVSAEYGVALFIGDGVLISPTTAERHAGGLMPTINVAPGTTTTIIRGFITSFDPLPDNLTQIYNPAYTERIANVCMDPSVVFEIRGNAATTSCDADYIWSNAGLIATASGSTITGLSGYHLDEGTTTTPAADIDLPLLIVGISSRSDNELAASTIYEVVLNTFWANTGQVLGVLGA